MSKNNMKYQMLSMLAMSSALASGDNEYLKMISNESHSKKSTQEEINKSKGLKEFIIEGKSYWAINYKNALKKFKKENAK